MNPIFQSVVALLLGPGLVFCLFAVLVLSDYYGATRKHLFVVLFCVAAFLSTFSVFYYISTFHWKPAVYDEAVYINAANFLWQSPFQEQRDNLEHPGLAKYLIGFGLWANDSLSKEPFCLTWNVDWLVYSESDRAIPRHIVVESRIVPMLLVSASTVMVYLIGRRVREVVGVLSAILFVSNRFVLGVGWRALLDPVLLFFLTLTWFFLTSPELSKTRSGLAVIFFGLGFASKFTMVMFYPTILVYLLARLKPAFKTLVELVVLSLSFPLSAYVAGCVFSSFGLGDRTLWIDFSRNFYQNRMFDPYGVVREVSWTFPALFLITSDLQPWESMLALLQLSIFVAASLFVIVSRRSITGKEKTMLLGFLAFGVSLCVFTGKAPHFLIMFSPFHALVCAVGVSKFRLFLSSVRLCRSDPKRDKVVG